MNDTQLGTLQFVNMIEIDRVLQTEQAMIITDENVYAGYYSYFKDRRVMVINSGENSKNFGIIQDVCSALIELGFNRSCTIIAVGGGVVGDIAGFAASVYMRGVKWINIPTTLLAQVDSAIGGKTGVDVCGYKNIAGSFYLPQTIYICQQFLSTLPMREWVCGLGEVIKTAALSEDIFAVLRKNFDDIVNRKRGIYDIVEKCARFKHGVTTEDFTEKGLRKILNLGHTVGHALETADNHLRSHGEYVLLGLMAESFMFKDQIETAFYNQLCELIGKLNIPPLQVETDKVVIVALADKKNVTGYISVMIATKAGNIIEQKITEQQFKEKLELWIKSL